MRNLICTVLVLCLAISVVSAQNIKSDNGNANNPYYSNTDTRELHVSNAEWKKILPQQSCMPRHVRAPQKLLLRGSTGMLAPKAPIIVRFVVINYFGRTPNLQATVVGPAFLSLCGKTVSSTWRTIPTTCIVPKYAVRVVDLTSAIFLMMALPQHISVIA
jgi:hypothetical protein